MQTGGLLPFPRTGCVLYAKAILSYCSEIRQVRPLGRKRLCSNPVTAPAFSYFRPIEAGNEGLAGQTGSILEPSLGNLVEKSQV